MVDGKSEEEIEKVKDGFKRIKDKSTSNFKKHLTDVHAVRFTKEDQKSESSLVSQPTIENSFHSESKLSLNDPNQKRMDRRVSDFFIHSMVSRRIVEQPSFRNMLSAFNSQWNVMGKDKLGKLIIAITDEIRNKVSTALCANKGFISVETDLWSDRRLRAYLGIVSTFVDSNFVRRKNLLGFQQVTGAHTAVNIKLNFNSLLSSVGINYCDLVRVTTDNARNMLKCFSTQLDGSKNQEIDHLISAMNKDDEMNEFILKLDESDCEDEETEPQPEDPYEAVFAKLDGLLNLVEGQRISCFAHSIQLVVID